jgi:hypothetical protein
MLIKIGHTAVTSWAESRGTCVEYVLSRTYGAVSPLHTSEYRVHEITKHVFPARMDMLV